MAYLDRLRERPLEAGATTEFSHLRRDRNGANSCGAANVADPVDGQPIAWVSRDFNGLRADAPGVNTLRSFKGSWPKILSIQSTRPCVSSLSICITATRYRTLAQRFSWG